MLVVPVAAVTDGRGFKRPVAAAVLADKVATTGGVTPSCTYDVAAGDTIVLVAIAVFAAVEVAARVRLQHAA